MARLADDLRAPASLRELARQMHGRYSYPVDTQLIAPDGRLLKQLPANELLMAGEVDLIDSLREAIESL